MIDGAISGLIAGGAYAVLGVCIVLLYRMVGVLNLAQAAIGAFGTFAMLMAYEADWPVPLALLVGLVVGAFVGGLLGLIMARYFAEAPVQTRSSVTIAMLIGLLTLGLRVFGVDIRIPPPLFTDVTFRVGGTESGGIESGGVVISLAAILIIVLAVVLGIAISQLLQRTHLGIMLRALSTRSTSAELLGVPSQQLTIGVWVFGGAISTLAMMLIVPTRVTDYVTLSLFILPALGAALLGQFRSFQIAIIGGIGLGVFEGMASQIPTISAYRTGISFVVILVALLWLQRGEVWDAQR